MKPAQARVLITGASGGIGRAMVAGLLQAGAQVLGVSRSPQRDAPDLRWVRLRSAIRAPWGWTRSSGACSRASASSRRRPCWCW